MIIDITDIYVKRLLIFIKITFKCLDFAFSIINLVPVSFYDFCVISRTNILSEVLRERVFKFFYTIWNCFLSLNSYEDLGGFLLLPPLDGILVVFPLICTFELLTLVMDFLSVVSSFLRFLLTGPAFIFEID